MPESLVPCTIARVEAPEHLGWAEGLTFSLPAELAAALAPWLREGRLELEAQASIPDLSERVRLHAAFTDSMPVSSRMPGSYQRVPMGVRTLVGRAIGAVERLRVGTWARFPRWPIDLSADFAADLARGADDRALPGAPTPVWLSHDLDTGEGLANLVEHFLDIEESAGARSTNYIVPCDWPIDHGLLGEVHARGHEVGVHGYDHSNKTPFCDSAERARRIAAPSELVDRYGIIGYRAPSLVRTRALIDDLAAHYRYDSSIPTSGGRFPVPNNGCASARPFRIGEIMEIPLTLPRDGSLRFLGHSPHQILDIWKSCAELIRRSGGVVSLLTHCEARFSGNPAMLDAYRRFLVHLGEDGRYRFSTAAEILGDTRAPRR